MIRKNIQKNRVFQFTPPVLIALITAIVGPLTLFHFEDVNQKRELQEQLLSKVLDHATTSENENGYLDRLSIVIALVEDNQEKFGLTFPSAEDIVSKRQQLTVQRLKSQLAQQTEKAELTRQNLADASSLVVLKNSELTEKNKRIIAIEKRINFLDINRDFNKKEIKELSTEKNQLALLIKKKQSEIDELDDDKRKLQIDVENANKSLQKRQTDIVFLTARDKTSQGKINSLIINETKLENKLSKSEQAVSNLEATIRDFKKSLENKREKLSKSEQAVSSLEATVRDLKKSLKNKTSNTVQVKSASSTKEKENPNKANQEGLR